MCSHNNYSHYTFLYITALSFIVLLSILIIFQGKFLEIYLPTSALSFFSYIALKVSDASFNENSHPDFAFLEYSTNSSRHFL